MKKLFLSVCLMLIFPGIVLADDPWYLAGGISADDIAVVYEPYSATNQADSYIPVAGSGSLTSGAYPGWQSGDGWLFDNGAYLDTGLYPTGNETVVMWVDSSTQDVGDVDWYIFGMVDGTYLSDECYSGKYWLKLTNDLDGSTSGPFHRWEYHADNCTSDTGRNTTAVMESFEDASDEVLVFGIVDSDGDDLSRFYLNGESLSSAYPISITNPQRTLWIGRVNTSDSHYTYYTPQINIKAVAVYSQPITAEQAEAVYDALQPIINEQDPTPTPEATATPTWALTRYREIISDTADYVTYEDIENSSSATVTGVINPIPIDYEKAVEFSLTLYDYIKQSSKITLIMPFLISVFFLRFLFKYVMSFRMRKTGSYEISVSDVVGLDD